MIKCIIFAYHRHLDRSFPSCIRLEFSKVIVDEGQIHFFSDLKVCHPTFLESYRIFFEVSKPQKLKYQHHFAPFISSICLSKNSLHYFEIRSEAFQKLVCISIRNLFSLQFKIELIKPSSTILLYFAKSYIFFHLTTIPAVVEVQVLSYPASHLNRASCKKFHFNELVVNVLRDNTGMIIFDLHGGCQRHLTVTAHFGTLTQRSVHPTVPVLLTKRNKN